MAETYKKLAHALADATTEDVYTVPANTSTIVKHIRLTNVDTSNSCHVKLYHRDNGDSSDTSTQILSQATIEAGGWAEFEGTIIMEAADILTLVVQAANDINFAVYGLELT